MLLHVRSFGDRVIDTSSCQSVSDLKLFLAEADNLPLESIQLHHGASCLSDDFSLSTMTPNDTLDVHVSLLGGKVHGSLARAGKVRGQTPKVDAQEKKKKPRGRAKRRLQYRKRFVAVVQQVGGRRRGPNSNQKA